VTIQFQSFDQFLAMGRYGAYVWPAYGLTLLTVGLNLWWARRLLARAKLDARRRLAVQDTGARQAMGEGA